jgi:ABC-type uncharacterized transport system involved in gliding motility auxiliary subunit
VVNQDRKANTTDPESRIMKTRQGDVQVHNAQAMVTADQCIVSAEITQQENDVHRFRTNAEWHGSDLEGCRD